MVYANTTNDAGGTLDRTGFAWAVFEWAHNLYYLMVVIYIFASYFARDVIGADLMASGDLDHLDPETVRTCATCRALMRGLDRPVLGLFFPECPRSGNSRCELDQGDVRGHSRAFANLQRS